MQPGNSDRQAETGGNKNPLLLKILGMGKNYFVKTPRWLKKFYPSRVWNMPGGEKRIYLSFDDGPHPQLTPFVLDELKKYGAKASFFCIGKNVQAWPEIYSRILAEGHNAGNHTQDHLNGFNTTDEQYISNVREAARHIRSRLFRPPYGRLRSAQARQLRDYRIIMWDVLSGDFDASCSKEKCLRRVIGKTLPGSIVVFHDSEKARERMQYVLPRMLEHFTGLGYVFLAIPGD